MRVVESFKVDDDDRGIAAGTLKLPASGDSVTVTWQLVDNTPTVSLEACPEFVEMPLRHGKNRAWYVTTFASISCLGLVRSWPMTSLTAAQHIICYWRITGPIRGRYVQTGQSAPRFDARHDERIPTLPSGQRPNPRLRPKFQSTPPAGIMTPETCRPRCCSRAGRHGTSWNPSPSSIMANRPDASVTR